MTRKILVADLLCGAGGSSTGCQRALAELGLAMDLVCVNHWPTAIDTHQRNHPEARHYVQDIATVRPHLLVPEGYLDLLMASPTCTHHSVARGGKPTSDQQRSDPWHIITWLTELRVKRLIIENVWEFIGWGPIDVRTGKPIASRKGEYFNAWIDTIRRLGFEPEWRKLNAADYGDATTRQRFILMARSDKRRVSWPTPTHQKRDDVNGSLFATVKPWKPAREIIDWNIKGRSIFSRPKPLAPKTLARILAGAIKFGWPEPFILLLMREIERSLLFYIRWTLAVRNAPKAIKARRKRRALARDLIARLRHFRIAPMEFARGGRSADPMLITLRRNASGSELRRPLPAITAGGFHLGLAQPIILSPHNSGAARTSGDPLPTMASEVRQGCARPMLVEPFVLSQASGGAARPVAEPIPTATTGGNGASHALISPYYGSGSGETCISATEPLPTVTSKGRFGMVVPVTQSNGGAVARDVADPIPTMTTAKGGEFAIVMPVTHHDGSDRSRDAGVDPLPTIAATGHVDLIEGTETYDILFRMLEPHELAAAMGFSAGDVPYEFAGTKTEKIKQIGNAVSVSKMKACVGALMADAAPKRKEPSAFLEAAE